MTAKLAAIDWRQPFYWWGPPWTPPHPRSLEDLVDSALLTRDQAVWLRAHVRSGGSAMVAALPSGAGKSTLAHALAEEIPAAKRQIYVRGSCETFAWEASRPESLTILVNEMSDHLPIYAWSGVARRCLDLAERGAQVIATCHAGSADDLIGLLGQPPVSATPAQIAALDVVVFLHVLPTATGVRRTVRAITRWTEDPESRRLDLDLLAI